MPLVHSIKLTELDFWGICPHILHCNHIKMGTTASNYSDVHKSTEFFFLEIYFHIKSLLLSFYTEKEIIYYCGEIFSQNSARWRSCVRKRPPGY